MMECNAVHFTKSRHLTENTFSFPESTPERLSSSPEPQVYSSKSFSIDSYPSSSPTVSRTALGVGLGTSIAVVFFMSLMYILIKKKNEMEKIETKKNKMEKSEMEERWAFI